MSGKGLASPQLLAHNEAVIFTDHLAQEAYWGWGWEERRRVGGREGRKEGGREEGRDEKKKNQERKMNV